jgi:hypothetical protein
VIRSPDEAKRNPGISTKNPYFAALHTGYEAVEGTAKNLLASRERLAKHRLPGVLAVAGRSVLAFRKPNSLGGHSFQDIRMDCSKGRKPTRFGGMQAGVAG